MIVRKYKGARILGPAQHTWSERCLTQSRAALIEAEQVIAGGVTSAARRSVKPTPLYIDRARGSRIWDIDGNEYIDYVMGFGPLVLGHSPVAVLTAVRAQLKRGILFGAQHRDEVAVAKKILSAVRGADRVILSNTGSEAVHVALRLARACTGRRMIVKFEGHYHGWLDNVAYGTPGQPAAPGGTVKKPTIPASAGLPPTATDLLVLPWNDSAALGSVFEELGSEIAAVIMEPVPQAGLIVPSATYLRTARGLATRFGACLIFDEIVTGFRLGPGGAAERFGVTPDLTVLGKALGGGFPISAVAGRRDTFQSVADGRVLHMGTYNGHAVNAAAACAALDCYSQGSFYSELEARSKALAQGLRRVISSTPRMLRVEQVGGIVHVIGLPPGHPIVGYEDLQLADHALVGRLAEALLCRGVHIQARGTLMVSAAHTEDDISETLQAAESALRSLR